MTNEEIARFFNNARLFIHGNPNLRDPHVEGGLFRTCQHFRNSSEHAILQIPVGCGKTGLMALLPFEAAQTWRHAITQYKNDRWFISPWTQTKFTWPRVFPVAAHIFSPSTRAAEGRRQPGES